MSRPGRKSAAMFICGRCDQAVIQGPKFGLFSNRAGTARQIDPDLVRWRHNTYNPDCEEPPPLVIRNHPEE